jgi:hypothetical protein
MSGVHVASSFPSRRNEPQTGDSHHSTDPTHKDASSAGRCLTQDKVSFPHPHENHPDLPLCPVKPLPSAPPRGRSSLPPGYSVFGAAHPHRQSGSQRRPRHRAVFYQLKSSPWLHGRSTHLYSGPKTRIRKTLLRSPHADQFGEPPGWRHGATTRVAVGFALNPLSVLKARYEVRTLSARSPPHAIL